MAQDRSTLVREFTQELARVEADEPFPLRLCRAYGRFADADGAAISLGYQSAERALMCVTDDRVSLAEDVQETLREGPTLEAFRTGRPAFGSSREEQEERWPVLMRAMPESVSGRLFYAFPMQPNDTLIGVVTLHLVPERSLAREIAELDFLADVLGAAIIGGIPSHDDNADRNALWAERDRISQATGMVVAQLGISPADALAVLRAHAFAQETSVADVARGVLTRKLTFAGPDGQDA